MELALANILRNAAEAVQNTADPSISVSVYPDSTFENAVISVTDSGSSLSAEQLKHFGKPQASSKAEGLGLGLTIVSSIVEQHLGILNFSRTPRGGLCVRIAIPLVKDVQP